VNSSSPAILNDNDSKASDTETAINSNQHGLTKSEKDAKESQKLQSQVEGIYALHD
jgi:hypothetical protein